jgi:hypothetical protein
LKISLPWVPWRALKRITYHGGGVLLAGCTEAGYSYDSRTGGKWTDALLAAWEFRQSRLYRWLGLNRITVRKW